MGGGTISLVAYLRGCYINFDSILIRKYNNFTLTLKDEESNLDELDNIEFLK